MLQVRKVRVYSVGAKSDLLPQQINEVEFSGNSVKDLLLAVRSNSGKSLYDEIVENDGHSFRHGYSLAVNREILRPDEINSNIPNLSEVVVIHLLQIPAGG